MHLWDEAAARLGASSATVKVVVSAAASVVAVGVWKLYLRDALLAFDGLSVAFNRRLAPRKTELFAAMEELRTRRGDGRLVVVDVGCGLGVNFRYYPEGTEVVCVDPNRRFQSMLLRAGNVDWPGVRVVEYHASVCEKMREFVEPEVADAVVLNHVLCSVSDVDRCLAEILRVLKPGGKAFILEHVLSPPCYPWVRRSQRFVNVIYNFIFGCEVNRTVDVNIHRAGFSRVDLEQFEAFELERPTRVFPFVRIVRSHISGTATK